MQIPGHRATSPHLNNIEKFITYVSLKCEFIKERFSLNVGSCPSKQLMCYVTSLELCCVFIYEFYDIEGKFSRCNDDWHFQRCLLVQFLNCTSDTWD